LKELWTLQFKQEDLQSFRNRVLSRQLQAEYPFLFEKIDLRLALNQPKNHFFEWLGAIEIYKRLEYLTLNQKYQFHRHRSKHEIFKEIVPIEVYDLLSDPLRIDRRQGPDIFAYSQTYSDWFFCEVKGPGDGFRVLQKEFFSDIEEVSGKEIQIIYFLEGKLI
jgi:hypothetical protein